MTERILVVAAHPDDEVLGCGGTIARHVQAGDYVEVVFVADGVTSRLESDEISMASRLQSAKLASEILGVTKTKFLSLPDNRLDSIPLLKVVRSLEDVIDDVKPSIIYTHHSGDLNVDHYVTHQAVMTACRPLPLSTVRLILAFEVLSSTEWGGTRGKSFIPNYFVDISSTLSIKIRALEAYSMEMRSPPHSRSFLNVNVLAQYRGFSVGIENAEAFLVLRHIIL